jgi:dephospho-CoA kinase
MSFIYVTGSAATGKSTLVKLLQEKGYAAFDEDDSSVGSAHEKITNIPVSIPPVSERDPEWFSRHEWKIRDGVMAELQKRSDTEAIFLFGNSINPKEASKIFSRIIYLEIDESSLRQRLANRTDNDYGKSEDEIKDILDKCAILNEQYEISGVLRIDASRPVKVVASDIIAGL